jgi:hypothetical protein
MAGAARVGADALVRPEVRSSTVGGTPTAKPLIAGVVGEMAMLRQIPD